MKATDLLKYYQTLVDDFEIKNNIKIKVVTLREICKEYSVKHENRYVFQNNETHVWKNHN